MVLIYSHGHDRVLQVPSVVLCRIMNMFSVFHGNNLLDSLSSFLFFPCYVFLSNFAGWWDRLNGKLIYLEPKHIFCESWKVYEISATSRQAGEAHDHCDRRHGSKLSLHFDLEDVYDYLSPSRTVPNMILMTTYNRDFSTSVSYSLQPPPTRSIRSMIMERPIILINSWFQSTFLAVRSEFTVHSYSSAPARSVINASNERSGDPFIQLDWGAMIAVKWNSNVQR